MNDDEKRIAHYKKMTETPVHRLVPRMAVPTIVSMLTSSIYNMADTYFVSQLGTSAAGAVGIVFSIMAIIQAIGFTIGQGGGVLVSRQLGEKKQEKAIETASTSFFLGLGLGVLLMIFGLSFLKPLMRVLGATETILPYAEAYGSYIFLACPVMCASFIMNNLLRQEGKATVAMVGITTGGILNILLDPIFIFILGFGTAGAAIATALSQCVSFIILLTMFLQGKSNVRFRITKVSRKGSVYLSILKAGMPTLSRQGLASIASVSLNVNASAFGDAAIAAISISNRVTFLLFSVLLGFGQGYQPVAGFNWGAGKYDRVLESTKFTATIGTVLITSLSLLCFAFAPGLIRLFRRDDLEVIAIGIRALRFQCLALPLQGICVTANMGHQSTLQSGKATFLALCRQGICFLPLIFTLPLIFGLNGVVMAQPCADVLTFCISLVFYVKFVDGLKNKVKEISQDG